MICLKLFLLLLSFALFSLCSSQEEADFLKSGLRQLKKKKNEGYDNEIPVVEGYVVQEEKKKKSHHVGKGKNLFFPSDRFARKHHVSFWQVT